MSVKNVEDAYPLSPMQEGLLFHNLYAPEGGLYVAQYTCKRRDVDLAALRRAWQRIVDRHSAFRTAFVWKNVEKPLQVVGRSVELPLQLEDWRGFPVSEQQERLDSYLETDRRRGFLLNKAPLLRIALFQTGDDTHQLVLTHHHLVVDGWSMALVFKEAFALYEAFASGGDLQLPPSVPYRNYIAWLQQQDLDQAETFWRETLRGFTTPTPLAIDRPGSASTDRAEKFAEQHLKLSTSATAALQTLTRQHQLTMNTLLQGAWALLLSRYSGEQDVVFGSVSAGRPAALPHVETMVGIFINNLPVRVRVAPGMQLIAWLRELQEQESEARQYEYSPLAQVQAWSDVARGVPLFSSIIAFQNFPVAPGSEKSNRKIGTLRSFESQNYPLALTASVGAELSLVLKYNESLFESSAIVRLLGHLQTILDAVADNGGRQRLSELPLLTLDERRQILSQWNNTETSYPRSRSIHELFEEQSARTPDKIAAICERRQITYQELNERANQLAHHLHNLGVGPEVPVGICIERGVEMLVGLLGILKAGGAFVPIDQQQPPERMAFMIDDARVKILLTGEQLPEGLPPLDHVLRLDAEWPEIAQQITANPGISVSPEGLAYVMYTSGSTGQPKGVSVPHCAVVRLVKETNFASLDEDEVFLQLAPISFDASTLELWGSLLNGAQLVIAPPATPSLAELGAILKDNRVTTLWFTAGLFHLMVDERLEDLKGVRQLLAGGDVLSASHVERYLSAAGDGAVLINGYGPTENTTFSCTHRMNSGWRSEGASVPVGSPIANTHAYVLDQQMELAPVGVAGELYVGGDGLARDYLRRPALTAEKFVPHPFSSVPGARLYRTGDQARWLPDGSIEFLGRIDQQVKIRGFRVELGEIEAPLNRYEGVREAVVVARAGESGARRLVAYVVFETEEVSSDKLRSYLQQQLPPYMVPSQFVSLTELPLTANGKVDRRALPDPEIERATVAREFCGPRTPAEEMLASIWSEVFRLSRVGIHDSFFELGGESILAIKLISRVNKDFDIELPVRALFEQPTIAELAPLIVRDQAERSDEAELLKLLEELGDVSEDEARSLLIS
jgi:amino acid adenylation domain-containing protein